MSNHHNNISSPPQPPRWALRLLSWFCPPELLEGVLGDMLEQFDLQRQEKGLRNANRAFIWNVLRFFHPYILFKNKITMSFFNVGLLKSHLVVASRTMWKHKFYTAINIVGLSTAIALVFLAFLFIQKELSYDQFHTNKDLIYRVYGQQVNVESGQKGQASAVTSIPLSKDLKSGVPAIAMNSRYGSSTGTVMKQNIPYNELINFVDADFLRMFNFPLLQGNPETALNEPTSIVISIDMAKKYFGTQNPINQSLEVIQNDSSIHYTVTAVIDPKKESSSLQFDFLVPITQFKWLVSEKTYNSYRVAFVENYIMLNSPHAKTELEKNLTEAIQKFSPAERERTELGIQALGSMHLESQIIGNATYTNPQKLYILFGIAFMVLIIATINFITLSTSHALNRLKEMGVRKIMGAFKNQLWKQFISEAFLLTCIASWLGILLAYFLLPLFNSLLDASISFRISSTSVLFSLSLIILIAFISGSLQQVVLVKAQTIDALRGKLALSLNSSWFNKGLVVLQFSLSIILIIGTLVMHAQMGYVQQKELGFDKERLVEISLGSSADKDANTLLVERFKHQLSQDPSILNLSASMNNANEPWCRFHFRQEDESEEKVYFNLIEPDYLQTMDIELVSGNDFRTEASNEPNAILVNEALVKHFGWENPLEDQIPGKNFRSKHKVIGVVKDFHFSSLHNKIEPLILALNFNSISGGVTGLDTYVWPADLYQIVVRVGPGNMQASMKKLENVWKEVNPNKPFQYRFVDQEIDAKYAEEKRWSNVTIAASLIAILIAWMGLLGITRLAVQKRTKEIGIRKVLGFSSLGITTLLSRSFIILVGIAIIIASPIAWWIMQAWLQSFTYSIALGPIQFLIAGGGVLLIALLSVGLQAYNASLANPSESLKHM